MSNHSAVSKKQLPPAQSYGLHFVNFNDIWMDFVLRVAL